MKSVLIVSERCTSFGSPLSKDGSLFILNPFTSFMTFLSLFGKSLLIFIYLCPEVAKVVDRVCADVRNIILSYAVRVDSSVCRISFFLGDLLGDLFGGDILDDLFGDN